MSGKQITHYYITNADGTRSYFTVQQVREMFPGMVLPHEKESQCQS